MARQRFGDAFRQHMRERADAVVALATAVAAEAEGYAKTNAPWADRTGAARERLTVRAEGGRTGSGAGVYLRIRARHNVSYGRFLEHAHEGRFAILGPTLSVFAPLLATATRQTLHGHDAPMPSIWRSRDVSSSYVPGPYRTAKAATRA